MTDRASYNFPTTHWSVVQRAGRSGISGGTALAELLRQYLHPLRAHLVWQRRVPETEADDFLQAFISEKVLERQLVSQAVREKGRFRTFLLFALNRFVSNQLRNRRRHGEFAGQASAAAEAIPCTDPTPSRQFEVAWARQVLALAARRMQDQCRNNGRADIWGIFEGRILAPTLEGAEPASYEALAVQYQVADPEAASNLLVTGKRMFVRSLKGVVGEYMGRDGEVEQEIAELRALLAGKAT